MINFIASREFSENGFCKVFWTSSELFFGFWRFSSAWFSKMCSRITDDHCEEEWFFLEKEFLYIYFRTRARLFRILGEMCHKGWGNCIPRVQRIILLENPVIEILAFYTLFRSLSEIILVLKRKSASSFGETAFRASRNFFQEKQILCMNIRLQTIFRL